MRQILFTLIFSFTVAAAAQLDSSSQDALTNTQNLLRSREQRDKYNQDHPAAAKADAQVKNLTGSQQSQDGIYDLSAKIFQTTTTQTGGDANKQKELLQKAASDPEGFYKSLTPEQQAQIRDLASQIEKQNGTVPVRK